MTYSNRPNEPISKNRKATLAYLSDLESLNNASPRPGYFCSFTRPQSGRFQPRFRYHNGDLDDGNFYTHNPKLFYNPRLLNLKGHNWFALTTFRPYESNDRKVDPKARHDYSHPTARKDRYASNFLGNYIDIDCMQNGVNPKDLLNHIKSAIKAGKMIEPTSLQDSGHGLYAIFLYNEPYSLSRKPKVRRKQIKAWKDTEQVIVRHFNVFTGKWFGKELGDIKSTNPSRILRMPNTLNVKVSDNGVNFSHPYTSYIIHYSRHFYDFEDLHAKALHFAPMFPDAPGLGQALIKNQYFSSFNHAKNIAGNIWNEINMAVDHAGNAKFDKQGASKQIRANKLTINRYKYSTNHHRRSPYHRGLLHGFNQFNLFDYIKDHGGVLYRANKSWVVTRINRGKNSHDTNSIAITQEPNIYSPKYKLWKDGKIPEQEVPTYSQLSRSSNLWNNYIGAFFNGDKLMAKGGTYNSAEAQEYRKKGYRKADSISAWIMAHKHIKLSQAKKERLKWFESYAKRGHRSTEYPFYEYGTSDVGSSNQHHINYQKEPIQNIQRKVYKDRPMRLYVTMMVKNQKQWQKLLDENTQLDNKIAMNNNKKITLRLNNIKKRNLKRINYLANHSRDSVIDWINKNVIDNNIARNYLVHQRCLPLKLINRAINRRLVVGIKGFYYHPYLRDSEGNYKTYHPILKNSSGKVVYENGKPKRNENVSIRIRSKKKAWHSPYVEFIWRRPRNSAESHSYTKKDYTKKDTYIRDLWLSVRQKNKYELDENGKRVKGGQVIPKAIAKQGTQEEIPCGADFVYLRPTKQTYKDKNGTKHFIYDKDTSVNSGSGKGIDNSKSAMHNYGFNFRTGTGKQRLFIFEASIDALSFLYQHEVSKDPMDWSEIQNATFLSLAGSGTKAGKTVQNFIKQQFAYRDDFKHIITCTDNDYSGYSVPIELTSMYGNPKEYVKHRKRNERLITIEVPISNDRPKNRAVLRSQASIPNKGQKGSFNKDWNAETQSMVRYHKSFQQAGARFNIAQYYGLILEQLMVDIGSNARRRAKYYHQPRIKSTKQAKKDISYIDAYINLASRVYINHMQGQEDINSTNPRTERMNVIKKHLSSDVTYKDANNNTNTIPGARNLFDKYARTVGSYTNPNDMKEYADDVYYQFFHSKNKLIHSEQFKRDMAKSHNLPTLQQAVNTIMNNMPDMKAKRLYATAINSTSNIWKRRIYLGIHDNPTLRRAYNRKYHTNYRNRIWKTFPEERHIYLAQNSIDNMMRQSSLRKLKINYPKHYQKAVQTASDTVKFGKHMAIMKANSLKNLVNKSKQKLDEQKKYDTSIKAIKRYHNEYLKYVHQLNTLLNNKEFKEVYKGYKNHSPKYNITRQDALNGINRARYVDSYLRDRGEYTLAPKEIISKNQVNNYKHQVYIINSNNALSNLKRKKAYHKNKVYRHRRHVDKLVSYISYKNRKLAIKMIKDLINRASTSNRPKKFKYIKNAYALFNRIKKNNSRDSRLISKYRLSHMSSKQLTRLL